MKNHFSWTELLPKLPAWISGGISFVTAVIGFVLLIQGHKSVGLTVLIVLGITLAIIGMFYVAFAKTPPLVAGGRGVYRFEKYRPLAFGGMGFLLCAILVVVISGQARSTLAGFISDNPANSAASGENPCFEEFFSNVSPDRIRTAEIGTNWLVIFNASDSKKEIIGILLTNLRKPLGALKIYAFPESDLFRVDSVVDANCQPVTDYSNINEGGKTSLRQGDPLRLPLGDKVYSLFLEYNNGSTEIVISSFEEIAP